MILRDCSKIVFNAELSRLFTDQSTLKVRCVAKKCPKCSHFIFRVRALNGTMIFKTHRKCIIHRKALVVPIFRGEDHYDTDDLKRLHIFNHERPNIQSDDEESNDQLVFNDIRDIETFL